MTTPRLLALLIAVAFPPTQAQTPSSEDMPIPQFNCDHVMSPDKAGATSTPSPNPLWMLYAEERKRGFKEGTIRIQLTFDELGSARTASILKSSGDQKIDKATVNWSLCTKIKAGTQSTVVIPVMYRW